MMNIEEVALAGDRAVLKYKNISIHDIYPA